MTTTSIKDVGSVLNLGVTATSASNKTSDGAFQAVFSSQTGNASVSDKKPEMPERKSKPDEAMRANERARKAVKDATKQNDSRDQISDEDLEKAAEAIGTAVNDLLAKMEDVLGISKEQLEDLMAQMQLSPEDLLQTENLSNLLLEAAGAADSLALLTDEQLYGDYQMLMAEGQTTLESLSEELGVSPETLTDALKEATEKDAALANEGLANNFTVQGSEEETTPVVEVKNENTSNQGEKKQDAKADGEMNNLVLQTIKEEAFNPETAEVSATAPQSNVDTENIMKQIMDYMKVSVKPDMSSLEMQLHPASLGTLQIQLAAKGGVLTANFVTQNDAVKAALESQMIQLKESFEEQGVKVEAIEVTVQTHQFEQNLEQGRERNPQSTESGRHPRTRRINLNGLDEMNFPEDLTQEEKMAAEVMAANGGTVDFTA